MVRGEVREPTNGGMHVLDTDDGPLRGHARHAVLAPGAAR